MSPDEVLYGLAVSLGVDLALCAAFKNAADIVGVTKATLDRAVDRAHVKQVPPNEVVSARRAYEDATAQRNENHRPVAVAVACILRDLAEGAS